MIILRNMVDFCIEVKTTQNLRSNSKGAIREVCSQVIGLCADNSNNSPSVILTDLTKNFIVISLRIAAESPLKFAFSITRCADFPSSLKLAKEESKECVSFNFGRPATPEQSDT
jgi:hypothetical protein